MKVATVACRHLGRFFKASVESNLEPIDFTIKALESDYKIGIETFSPNWYSQSPFYYLEELLEDVKVEKMIYIEEEEYYEKERMYWLGYCLQTWSNKTSLKGKDISSLWGKEGIRQLHSHYKIYHTVDPLYVLQDSIEINEIKLDFDEILIEEY